MLKLNRDFELGFKIVRYLKEHEKDGVVKCTRLAGDINEPHRYVERIAYRLVKSKVCGVKRGPGGGVFLNKVSLNGNDLLTITTRPDNKRITRIVDPTVHALEEAFINVLKGTEVC